MDNIKLNGQDYNKTTLKQTQSIKNSSNEALFGSGERISYNPGQDFVSRIIEPDKFMRGIGYMGHNYEALKILKAYNATPAALSAMTKGQDVFKSLESQAGYYSGQISAVLNDDSLSADEKEDKIKTIERKVETAQKEAVKKFEILKCLSDAVYKLNKISVKMNDKSAVDNAIDFFANLVKTLNPQIGNYSNVSSEELEQKFSSNLTASFDKKTINDLKSRQEELKNKEKRLKLSLSGNNLKKEEREKFEEELKVCSLELSTLDTIIASFSFEDDN